MNPKYPLMTSSVNRVISNPIIEKYGFENIIWPIVVIKDNKIHSYLYEKSDFCNINSIDDNRPSSISFKKTFFIDYTKQELKIYPKSNDLLEFVAKGMKCSYDRDLSMTSYNTADLDYVWKVNNKWKAIEFTTLWMPLFSKAESERLVGLFNRRPSWKGSNGPHGMRKLIDAAHDLDIEYWMVCANSKKGVSNNIITSGNSFWFKLTHDNIDRILKGYPIVNSHFGSFTDLIDWL